MYFTIDPYKIPAEYKSYKLCYIDRIPETYTDYTPAAKAYRETDEYKEQLRLRDEKLRVHGYMTSEDYYAYPALAKGSQCQEYPTPDYIKGEQELYAYFTPLSLDEQWGDDWDDSPYECNAGLPYDIVIDETIEKDGLSIVKRSHEITIARVPFIAKSYNAFLPQDYTCNSPFSVDMINRGVVAWLYDYNYETKKYVTIHAGETIEEFVKKIAQIAENNPGWEPSDD